MAIFAALILMVSVFSCIIGKVIENEQTIWGAGVFALAGIGFAILSLRDEA